MEHCRCCCTWVIDTKAIQVDSDGVVTSFQMNDRCAAGCGRYLGYIADDSLMVAIAVIALGSNKLGERGGRVLKLLSGSVMLLLGAVLLWRPRGLFQPGAQR